MVNKNKLIIFTYWSENSFCDNANFFKLNSLFAHFQSKKININIVDLQNVSALKKILDKTFKMIRKYNCSMHLLCINPCHNMNNITKISYHANLSVTSTLTYKKIVVLKINCIYNN